MPGSFPINLNHTFVNIPTNLTDLEALNKAALENTIDQLPQQVGNKTFVNGIEITGQKFLGTANKKTLKANPSADLVDLISLKGDKNKFYSFKGDDFIFSKGASNLTDAGEGNDTVFLSGNSNTKTNLGKGNDLIVAVGNQNLIGSKNLDKYNEGNDSVAINGTKNTVYTGSGDDIALLTGENSLLDSGSGNDKVAVSGTKNTIKTYTGNDIVSVDGTQHDVDTDRGNDEVQVKGDSNLIKTGIGNDTVYLSGKNNKILTGDDNDLVIVDNLTEGSITYTPEGGFIDLGKGDDQVTINTIAGNFTIEGGSGTNKIKFANIDLNLYSSSFQNNVLNIFRTDGTGETLTAKITNVQNIEFSGPTVYSLTDLTTIEGKTIQFNSAANPSSVVNSDGKSNVLQLDFDFSDVIGVEQTGSNQFKFSYLDSNSIEKDVDLTGIYHIKTSDGFSINLAQTPNVKTVNADISTFKTSTTRTFDSKYTANIFDPLSSEAYSLDLDVEKDTVLALDTLLPTQLKSYSASELVFERYGNSTVVSPGIANNTVLTNADGKTNIADFSAFNTGDIHRVERLKLRSSEIFQGVTFTPTSPYFSTLPATLDEDLTVAFDGIRNLDTIVNNFNLANPNNTISHNGTGTSILTNGSVSLNNVQDLNNQYRVIFDDGGEKQITLDRFNFINTAEGQKIHIEQLFDSLKDGLDQELNNIDTTDPNYSLSEHNGLKNTQFARGAYNVLSALGDPNKYAALASLGGASYPLLPTTPPTSLSLPVPFDGISSSNTITPATANLIDGADKNFFSTAKKANFATENFILDLGAPTQFSKVQIDARADFDGLFPDSFEIFAGNAVGTLSSLGRISSAEAQAGYELRIPTTARYIKFEFANKALPDSSEYYAEIGEVTISNRAEVNHPLTGIQSFSTQVAPDVATRAIDGALGNRWRTTSTAGPKVDFITIDLGATKDVSKLSIFTNTNANYFPTNFDIYVGDDPAALNLAASIKNHTGIVINPASNDFLFPQQSGRYVQLRAITRLNAGTYSLRIAEIDVKGFPNPYFTVPTTINSVSSTETSNPSSNALHINDNNVNTFYSSPVDGIATSHSLTFDLGSSRSLTDFNFLERPGFANLFPDITNVFIDDNPTPVTAVSNLNVAGTDLSFDPIVGQFVKVEFNSKDDGTGNFYAQIAEVVPQQDFYDVNLKSDALSLVSSLQNSLTFTAKESDYKIDEATKGLYALRIASILRNRPDVIDKIKNSGLVIEITNKPTIPNGSANAEGIATFTQGSNSSYKIELTADSFFSGAYDNEDGKAVDIHETLHILDYLDDSPDGVPVLFNGAEQLIFGNARTNLFAPLDIPAPPLGEGIFYSPGIDNPTKIANAELQGYANSKEFLAYASTIFFEKPDELIALGSDGLSIYDKLSNYFGLSTNVADQDLDVIRKIPPVI